MDMTGIQSGVQGIAMFDLWYGAVRRSRKSRKCHGAAGAVGSPLVAAAAAAFEQYINVAETQMAAQISGLTTYALSPTGKAAGIANPLTSNNLAPFLALNILA